MDKREKLHLKDKVRRQELGGAVQRRKETVPGEAVRRTSGMADYWHKAWSCPFYAWSDRQRVMCEGGVAIKFPDVKAAVEYMDAYCACGENGWKRCTIATCLLGYYDRKEQGEHEKY